MLRNKKVLAVIISVAAVLTFSYLVIVRASNSNTAAIQPEPAGLKENNMLELGFSNPADSPAVHKTPAVNSAIIVDQAAVCLEIKDRRPAQEFQRISANAGRVFCWSILLNGQGKKVRYIWYIGEKASPSDWLSVTSNRFRAWCPKKINPKASGPARVDIVDEQGRILKSIEFEIIPPRSGNSIQIKYS